MDTDDRLLIDAIRAKTVLVDGRLDRFTFAAEVECNPRHAFRRLVALERFGLLRSSIVRGSRIFELNVVES